MISTLNLTDPNFCKVGNTVFVFSAAQNVWKKADLDKMKNPDQHKFEIFEGSDQGEFPDAKVSSGALTTEKRTDVEAVLDNPE